MSIRNLREYKKIEIKRTRVILKISFILNADPRLAHNIFMFAIKLRHKTHNYVQTLLLNDLNNIIYNMINLYTYEN